MSEDEDTSRKGTAMSEGKEWESPPAQSRVFVGRGR